MIIEQEKYEVGLVFAKKMLKKFNREEKAYERLIKCMLHYARYNSGGGVPDNFTPERIIKRAEKCLKPAGVVRLTSHYAKMLFEMKEVERARNVFEELIAKHPKR